MVEKFDRNKFQNDSVMRAALASAETIAVVGLSEKNHRASNSVARYLQSYYRIIPVNPSLEEVLHEKCYPDLLSIPSDIKIDIVDVFRRSDQVLPIAEQALSIDAGCLWLQLGVVNESAGLLASEHGMSVVMDSCIAVVHSTLRSSRS